MPKKHTQSNKTRKRTSKDMDELAADCLPEKAAKLSAQPVDVDLPGDGQFYCVQCARYFISDEAQEKHGKTKGHLRRLKALQEVPYTQKEADAAGGVGNYDRNAVKAAPDEIRRRRLHKKAAKYDSGFSLN